ncbi:MAG TPA: sugar ABC transporter permease [Firmicutes bacterium]|jgi:raffinose/stachyose/melibiose transport system permease protein|nr:sugar ABC transporter permease [Bacillota bacterium]
MHNIKFQKKLVLFSFLLVPVTLLMLFVVYPTVKLLHLSFTDWDGVSKTLAYIGTRNFKHLLFESPEVWISLKNNWIYFYVHLLFIPVELLIAVLLDGKIRGSKFFKTVSFMPYILNGTAIAYIFSYFYSPIDGAFNAILQHLGLGGIIQNWLSNELIVTYTLATVSLWRFAGLHIILFLAGLQSIPQEIFEAAEVDGANFWHKFWRITVPSIGTVMEIVLFMNIRGALQVFDIPFLITSGGPGYASSTFTLYTIDTAFKFNNIGLAAAMGITLLLMIVVFSWLQQQIFKAKRYL